MYLGEDEVLVLQMIGFVERLPVEWESQWASMQMSSRHDLAVEEGSKPIHHRHYFIVLLTLLEDCEMSKLEQKFAEIVHDPPLKPLLQVIQGLMRFLPSSRITVDKALGLMCNTPE